MTMRANIAVNLGGRLWMAIMNFAFVPVYLHILGLEAYGLIGFFASLVAVFLIMDAGLSTAINRELARLGDAPEDRRHSRDFVRTFETIYWSIGLGLGLGTTIAAPWIAENWLRTSELATSEATNAVRLMGMVVLFRWPVALYSGALLGLQKPVRMNSILAANATLQAGGAALVIWLISPTITAFFAWQCLTALVQVSLLAFAVWRGLHDRNNPARFQPKLLRDSLAFSAGMAGITLLSVILTQLDKAVLSRLLSLADFGVYALASAVSSTLSIAATSVFNATFPIFSRQVAQNADLALAESYHMSTQALCILVMPPAITLMLFAEELLTLYTGDPVIAAQAHGLVSLLTAGNAILALMLMPVAMQLAHGWVKLSLYKNILAVLIYVPALLIMAKEMGPMGAALVWLGLTCAYLLLEVPVMHSRLLTEEKWRWYLADLVLPTIAASVPLIAARLLLPAQASMMTEIGAIGVAGLASVLAAMMGASHVRRIVGQRVMPRLRAAF